MSKTLTAALLAAGQPTACGSSDASQAWPAGTPVCEQEDSPGPCYWDADAAGNGYGRSYWVDAEQNVHYLN